MTDWATLLVFTTPVALAALGESVTQRSGVINIGLEGMMLLGAYVAAIVNLGSGNPWLGLLAGSGAGLGLAILLGYFCVRLSVDQIVVGTAINLLALGVTSTLYRARFGQTGSGISLTPLPHVLGVDPVVLLALALVPVTGTLLYHTNWGLAARSAGEYPPAVEAAGFSVHRLRTQAVWIGGLFAGLAGAYLAIGVTSSFNENMTAGRGFVAIALVTFGRWRPSFVFLAALLVGYVTSLQFTLQARGVGVPKELLIALPYIVALLVLVVVGRGTAAPAALTKPYRKEA